jgi:antirestriction protein ArdC
MTYNQAKEARRAGPQGREVDHRHLLQELYQGGRSPRYREKPDEEARRVLKAYPVFNADQVERSSGALPSLPPRLISSSPKAARLKLDAFFASAPGSAPSSGDEAYYEPTA